MTSRIVGIELAANTAPLNDGTLNLQPGEPRSIHIDYDDVRGVLMKDGTWDFGVSERALRKYNMVELIKDKRSSLYNTGKLLVKKMLEIKDEGQVYYWKIDPEKRYTAAQQEELESRKQVRFVRIGDGSNSAPAGTTGKPTGRFDSLKKWEGTTNCSTAILDAVYRTLGGKVDNTGKVITIGGVNGVPLTDESFSGFNHMFQGEDWDKAVEDYGLGYKISLGDLKYGDIVGTGGHRMVYLKTLDGTPIRISAIQANLKTATLAVKVQPFTVQSHWKLARLFDMRE